MKLITLLVFVCTFFYLTSAEAIPCQGGKGIIYKGDVLSQIINQCGEPDSKSSYSSPKSSLEQWTYYRNVMGNLGYTRLSIFFTNERVSQIQIQQQYFFPFCQQSAIVVNNAVFSTVSCANTIYNTPLTNLCGPNVGIGDDKQYVASVCGAPIANPPATDEVTELYYSQDNLTLILRNNELVDWK